MGPSLSSQPGVGKAVVTNRSPKDSAHSFTRLEMYWATEVAWGPAWQLMASQSGLCTSCGPPSLHRTALLQARPRLLLPVHSLVCLAAFGLALPLAISLFPQMSEIETSQLEPEIARATSSRTVVYNKGL